MDDTVDELGSLNLIRFFDGSMDLEIVVRASRWCIVHP